ncbi:MAG: 30S ribosomal protein S11 [Candidatus Komeilibacteria bacterium CG_4_9_14_0_8_um_filter_36_9]|uniref:Small ribosomal subunit protein uS11 n=2 Tax=Candidatus Komeiliibacteriota TaxID=1817908 RepID=A0A2M8DPY9_9BACT|nr:MAG: 30S ribosomal protein S11 [Candidatus Komeilibacteria bacterium CG_4_10_14_0_8_um_filter_37_78]PJC00923.1 MAG: 30S ribosomal protein S11 [Candidatus Komeilibacteria bacterium CG_4_9_14_0_8_um_filter_36_9]
MSRKKRLLEKQKKKQTSKTTVVNKLKGGKKKKVKKMIKRGQAHISATYNNTVVTITDLNGNTIGQASAGALGFKGPKKATPYAATIIVKHLAEKVKAFGLQDVDVFVKGVGSGRESAIRALHADGINVMSIKDVTPIPHNGCRPRKVRRI